MPCSRQSTQWRSQKKCKQCRKDRKKCNPVERDFERDGKCENCIRLALPCGPNLTKGEELEANTYGVAGASAMDASILLANDYPSGFQQRTPEAEADGIRFEQSADNWDGGLSVLENELTRHEGYVEPAQPPLPIYSATTPVIPKASFAQHRQLKAAVRRTREIVSAEEVISVIIPPEGTSCEDVACTLSRVDDRLDRISPQFVLDSVTTRESVPGNDHVSENKTVLLAAVRRASELRIRNDSSATYISNLFRTCVGDLDMYEEHEVLRWLQMSDAISNFDLRLANSFVAIASDESHYFKRLAQDQGLPLPPDCDTPFPPIQLIIEDGNLAVVRQLDRSRYTEKDLLGRQGIHIAAVSNKLEILRHLLQTDHDRSTINSRDGRGRTPFFLAALHGNEDIVKALIDAKAAVHDRDNEGHTILEAAASGGHLGIVDQLLKAGAKVNEQLMWKASTPLQAAVRGGHKHTAMFLLQKKADLAVARGYDGKRAVELAQQGGYEEIVALLKEYEATLVGEVAPSEVLFQQGLRSPFHYQLPTTAQEPNGDVDWLRVTRDGDYTVEF